MGSRRGASAGHAAASWGSASLLAQPLSQQVDLLSNMELLWVVSCLLVAAVADPLGAGAVGDGCELQKVSEEHRHDHQCFNEPECHDVCGPVESKVCTTIHRQECKQVPKEHCSTVQEEKCATTYKQECHPVSHEECHPEYEDHCHDVPEQKCYTAHEDVCSTVQERACTVCPSPRLSYCPGTAL